MKKTINLFNKELQIFSSAESLDPKNLVNIQIPDMKNPLKVVVFECFDQEIEVRVKYSRHKARIRVKKGDLESLPPLFIETHILKQLFTAVTDFWLKKQ